MTRLNLLLSLCLVFLAAAAQGQLLGEDTVNDSNGSGTGAVQGFLVPADFAPARAIDDSILQQANQSNANIQSPAPPLSAASLLHGRNTFTLTLLDDKTLRPVAAAVVHAVIPPPAMVLYEGSLPGGFLGRLESKRLAGSSGSCRWEGLGRLTVLFQVFADGYLPKKETFTIPQAGSAIMRLIRAGAVTGRLIDAVTGKGLGGIKVALTYPSENRANHYRPRYETTSGADGRFHLNSPPAEVYEIKFPDLFYDFARFIDKAETKARSAYHADPDKPDAKAFQKTFTQALAETQYFPPQLDPVDLNESATRDLGTIRLEREPTLDLEITYEGAAPLANFPFEINFETGSQFDITGRFKTDAEGRARLSLAGWRPGMAALVYAPAKLGSVYKASKIKDRRLDITTLHTDRDWYDTLAESLIGDNMVNSTDIQAVINVWGKSFMAIDPFNQRIMANGRVKFDDLTPQQKQNFSRNLVTLKKSSAFQKRMNPLPEHPNYVFFTPQAGRVSRVRLDYKPTPDDLDITLRFIDKSTHAPIPRFKGIVRECAGNIATALERTDFYEAFLLDQGDRRTFQSSDVSGFALVPALTLSPEMLSREKELNATTTTLDRHKLLSPQTCLSLVVDAPGYVRQAFTIPLAQARAGGEMTFELERAAAVRGRVLLAATGDPPTSPTLQAFLRRVGLWGRDAQEDLPRHLPLTAELRDTSATLAEELRSNAQTKKTITSLKLSLTPDGRFAADGLRPGETWSLLIDPGVLPCVRREPLTLQAGLNDLGDIMLPLPGWLTGSVTDERGQGLAGVAFEFPVEKIARHDRATTRTREGGGYRLDLLPLKHDDQIVRLFPPWGDAAETTTSPPLKTDIFYETVMTLDRGASQTLNARLGRGAPLLLRLPQSPARDALAQTYAIKSNYPWLGSMSKEVERPYFAVRRVTVQGLDATSDGLTFGLACDVKGEGLRLTTGTLALRLDHVPPGRCAVLVEGGLMDAANDKERGVELFDGLFDAVPLAYGEFTMGATTTTLALAAGAAAAISLEMPDLPALNREALEEQGPPIAILERKGPQSTFAGNVLRRRIVTDLNKKNLAPGLFQAPMVGSATFFFRVGKHEEAIPRHTVFFHGLPPGTYHVQAYSIFDPMDLRQGRPDFETTLDVTSQPQTIHCVIPYSPPR